MIWLWGWHVIEHVIRLKSRKIFKICVSRNNYQRIEDILKKNNIKHKIEIANDTFFRDLKNHSTGNLVHQGIACFVDQIIFHNLNKWINSQNQNSVLIACDQIVDCHNLGAIIRTSAAFGVNGILVTKMHCAPFDGMLAKSAAGALEITPVIQVTNLTTSLKELQKNDFMIFGLDEKGGFKWQNNDWHPPKRSVIILGQEGCGLRELTKKTCDAIISITTKKDFATLNVSVAAALAIYKFCKQE